MCFFVNMYDESFQVPLIIRWPGVVEGGRVIDELVSNVDFFPTFLGMVGVPVPAGLSLQGQDFSPLLRGEDVSWRNVIFAEYTPQTDRRCGVYPDGADEEVEAGPALPESGRQPAFRSGKTIRGRFTTSITWIGLCGGAAVEQGRSVENPHQEIIAELQEKMTAWQESTKDPALELEGVLNEAREETKRRWQ